jgi:hypothetical protein
VPLYRLQWLPLSAQTCFAVGSVIITELILGLFFLVMGKDSPYPDMVLLAVNIVAMIGTPVIVVSSLGFVFLARGYTEDEQRRPNRTQANTALDPLGEQAAYSSKSVVDMTGLSRNPERIWLRFGMEAGSPHYLTMPWASSSATTITASSIFTN